ncbi:MAG TPA: hypothetical protein VJ739_07955 [Gemmataceae bacterium]|nr:hypothetical protein [Gemmataceae bacterium]
MERLEDRTLPSTLQAISLPPANQPPSDTADGRSLSPSVSADGRFVAFQSDASNLIPGQQASAEPFSNVFLLDHMTGAVTLVSSDPSGRTPNPTGGSDPIISADGRYVAYDVGLGFSDVAVFDRATGQQTLVSHDSALPDKIAVPGSALVAMSANGRYILFSSFALDLVPNQVTTAPNTQQLFLYDQVTKTNVLVSHAAGQTNISADADASADNPGDTPFALAVPTVSPVADDGTVVYVSNATNLVSGLTGAGGKNVYLYNPTTQANQLLTAASGAPLVPASAIISRDGSTVAYTSTAADLVPGQTGGPGANVFRYDRSTGTTTFVANASSGGSLAISSNGQFTAFFSDATNVVTGQSGAAGNVFLYDARSQGLTLVSHVSGSPLAGAGGVLNSFSLPGGLTSDADEGVTRFVSMSDDGSRIAYVSTADDIVPNQSGATGLRNIFLYDRATGQNTLVSGTDGSASVTGDANSDGPVVSGDGNAVAFLSSANDLAAGVFDANGVRDVFVFTPGSPTITVASRSAFVQQAVTGDSFSASVSADGRYTVFTSTATDLVPNQTSTNPYQNVFLFDKTTGAVTLVNHVPGLAATTGDGGLGFASSFQQRPPVHLRPVISADGNFVAFASYDDNLVPNEADGEGSAGQLLALYLYDVRTGQVTLVNHEPGSPSLIDLEGNSPAISADGSYVAFLYGFIDFTQPSAQSGLGFVVLYDRAADSRTVVTPFIEPNLGTAREPSISDDGRFVAYQNNSSNVYVFDRTTGTSTLVSHAARLSTTAADGVSSAPVISHDGSAIAFVSLATNLVPGQTGPSFNNVFVYENDGSGTVRLVSGVHGSPTATGFGNSDSPAIDGDGGYVAYRSDATATAGGLLAPSSNIFEFNAQTGTQTLVSHQAGQGSALTAGAGGASEPVIDDDGHLISYVSTAGDLVPGQSGPAGVKNVFVWMRQTNANILASGQDGSPTAAGNADSDGPLLTRDSFPGFSSVATNLLAGLIGTSVAYINTLVAVALTPNALLVGSAAGSVVGQLSVSSLLAGQFLPPAYSLPANEGSNGLFGLSGPALLALFQPSASGVFTIRLHVNVGFGDDPVLLEVFAIPAPAGSAAAHPLLAELVAVRVGKSKTKRLMVEVFDLVNGAEVEALLCPFQGPSFHNVTLIPLDLNGDGIPDLAVVTARKGKHTLMALLPA